MSARDASKMLQFRVSAIGRLLRFHATTPDGDRVLSGFFWLDGTASNPSPHGFIHTWGEGSWLENFESVEDWAMALG